MPQCTSATTVAPGIARQYKDAFGVSMDIVRNATPYVDIEPTPVHSPLRIVHHGAALRNRDLDLLVDAVLDAGDAVEMDMYLMPNDVAYVEELRQKTRGTRVRVHDGIEYDALIATLNQYDVGFYMLPPVSVNHEYALPNKFFDFVQARLALVIGPSKEMAPLVRKYDIGVVTRGFSAAAGAAALADLKSEDVARWKANSNKAARDLSSAREVLVWRDAVEKLLGESD